MYTDVYIYMYFCCPVAKSCLTLCDPIDCSMPGFPSLHYLPEFVQTLVHWVPDAIQPSHPLSLPSPPAFNLSIKHTYVYIYICMYVYRHFPGGSDSKEFACNAGDLGFNQSLGQKDALEEEMATHSSILAWRLSWTEEPSGLQFIWLQSQTQLKWLSMHGHMNIYVYMCVYCIDVYRCVYVYIYKCVYM